MLFTTVAGPTCAEQDACFDQQTLLPRMGICANGGFCRNIVHGGHA